MQINQISGNSEKPLEKSFKQNENMSIYMKNLLQCIFYNSLNVPKLTFLDTFNILFSLCPNFGKM